MKNAYPRTEERKREREEKTEGERKRNGGENDWEGEVFPVFIALIIPLSGGCSLSGAVGGSLSLKNSSMTKRSFYLLSTMIFLNHN